LAFSCWVCAKSITLPPGRTAFIAVWISAVPPTARITASVPRPSVAAKAAQPRSPCRHRWIVEAELRRNRMALRIEIAGQHARPGAPRQSGQHHADRSWPITSTVSSAARFSILTAFRTVFTGSRKAACSNGTSRECAPRRGWPQSSPSRECTRQSRRRGLKAGRRAHFLVDRHCAKVCLRQ